MPMQRYVPNTETERNAWLRRYAAMLQKYAAFIGIGAEELADTLAGIAYYLWMSETFCPAVRQDGVDAIAARNHLASGTGSEPVPVPTPRTFAPPPPAVLPGLFNRIFKQVQRIKLHPGYDEGIGRELGILPIVDATEHPVPEFTLTTVQGAKVVEVHIDYTKFGHGGVLVDCRINAGPWLPLGHFTQKTICDSRPLAIPGVPETRDYRLRWCHKDQAHGDWSIVQTALVGA
ncbi:hypothetical protein [uncultured Thiodictyon sp.]|uniref:hypothetical protein n=1 Tax=uncultured Thiodictyon sp. TaxID=1846217 RepID=UPI0025E7A3C1|nr:hypothetical protein [uncultured Thiodictyon sp.]